MPETERPHFDTINEELDYLHAHPHFFARNYEWRQPPRMPKPQKYALYSGVLVAFLIALVVVFTHYDISITPKQ